MSSGDLPAIIGAIGLVIGTVFTGLVGLGQRRTRLDQEILDEVSAYRRWHPRVMRGVALLRATVAQSDKDEPPTVEDLIEWPPPKPKHARRGDEVTADDAG